MAGRGRLDRPRRLADIGREAQKTIGDLPALEEHLRPWLPLRDYIEALATEVRKLQ